MSQPEKDMINQPDHYTVGGIETIDAVKAKLTPEQFTGYLLGTALVYLMRANHKGSFEDDVKKANWYTARLVREIKSQRHKGMFEAIDTLSTAGFDIRAAPRPVLDGFGKPEY